MFAQFSNQLLEKTNGCLKSFLYRSKGIRNKKKWRNGTERDPFYVKSHPHISKHVNKIIQLLATMDNGNNSQILLTLIYNYVPIK
jgi:hypothetical protein